MKTLSLEEMIKCLSKRIKLRSFFRLIFTIYWVFIVKPAKKMSDFMETVKYKGEIYHLIKNKNIIYLIKKRN